jgi:putative addiction module component (TIGR02574 family)
MVEDEINESADWTKDEKFIAQLERRSEDYKSGKVKGVPWEEVKKQILASTKPKTKK